MFLFLKLCFRTLPSMWQPIMQQLKTLDTTLKAALGLEESTASPLSLDVS